MRPLKLISILLFLFSLSYAQNPDDVTIAKRVRIQSTVLGEERTLFIYTPTNYDLSNDSYPVMYALDGSAGSIHFISGVVSQLSSTGRCPEMIIVAIGNTDRNRDMSPTISKTDINGDVVQREGEYGGADKFLKFIKEELFAYIEKNYRTLPYRIFTGHSFGGLCATHAFLSHNSMFNSYIAVSPSLYWDEHLMNRTADEMLEGMNLKNKFFYYSVASDENPIAVGACHIFYQTLRKKAPEKFGWMFDYLRNEDHGSQGLIALYNGLKFIFDAWKIDNDGVIAGGLEYINSFYNKLTTQYGYQVSPTERDMNTFGYSLKNAGNLDGAIKIFESNVKKHPKSPNTYDSLAETYLAAGKYDLSVEYYKKAVDIATKLNDGNLDVYKRNLENVKPSRK